MTEGTRTLSVLGAAGQAVELAEVAHQVGWRVGVFVAQSSSQPIAAIPVVAEKDHRFSGPHALGVGSPSLRARLHNRHRSALNSWPTLVHPFAAVSSTARLSEAALIQSATVVSAGVVLGQGVLVNYGSTIGHDSHLAPYVCVMPGARVSGNCWVGEETMIGANAVILPNITIAPRTRVGAGAVVTKSLEISGTYVGAPARLIHSEDGLS